MGMSTLPPFKEILNMQLKELSEDQFTDINEESVCDKKDGNILKQVMSVKCFMLKELLELFHDIEREKDKMLKANPNLEKRMTLLQGIENTFAPCGKLHKKKTSTVRITLDKCFQ